MAANDTPLYDLIEMSGINAYTTFSTSGTGGGAILGLVDEATYTDGDSDNSATQIGELNETYSGNGGTLTIDGVDYVVELYVPDGSGNDVTITYSGGSVDLGGNGGSSDIVFIVASPLGGGSTRWFAAIDDSVGDLPGITSIQTRGIDWDPAGDDVQINLGQNNDVTACFAVDTLIATPDGPRHVQSLKPGDPVNTLDHGAQPILWTGVRSYAPRQDGADKHRAIVIRRSAFCAGLPSRPLLVSPQHRILVASPIVRRLFGVEEILVPAVKLLGWPGIRRDDRAGEVTYHHLLLARHEILFAENLPAESFLPEAQALRAYGAKARSCVRALLKGRSLIPARPIQEVQAPISELLRRHRKNAKPLITRPRGRRASGASVLRVVQG